MKLSLIIPCYNEEKNLPFLFKKIEKLLIYKSVEVIIVENGSDDNSREVIKSLDIKSARLKFKFLDKNKGYGYGIIEGLKVASGDLLAWTHADLQTNPNDIIEGLKLYGNKEDKLFVKGRRYGRKITDQFFTIGMSFIASIYLRSFFWDINAQPTIFPRKFFKEWHNPPNDFSLDFYSYYLAKKKGYNIKRYPVYFNKRLFGISKWNFNFYSKIRFIIRTFKFIKNIKRRFY